jgi:hypothetical protein
MKLQKGIGGVLESPDLVIDKHGPGLKAKKGQKVTMPLKNPKVIPTRESQAELREETITWRPPDQSAGSE